MRYVDKRLAELRQEAPRPFKARPEKPDTRPLRDSLVKAQEGSCPICLETLPAKPNLDHCHATGYIRAVLCHHCNIGLGHFRDDPERLERAAEYVRRHAAQASVKGFRVAATPGSGGKGPITRLLEQLNSVVPAQHGG
jgi:hypothetical protein